MAKPEAIPENATFRYEKVPCGKRSCRQCGGTDYVHGPYWYAYWETGGRKRAQMHKVYVGKATGPEATPEELRAYYAGKKRAKAKSQSGQRQPPRPRGFEYDFSTIGIAPGVPFEEARRAYKRAARAAHPDLKGGREAEMKEINAAWDRLRRGFYQRP